jgi:hypothetical protein
MFWCFLAVLFCFSVVVVCAGFRNLIVLVSLQVDGF